jgi:hypothetical protein
MSSQKIATTRVDIEGQKVVWTFSDNTTRTVRYEDLPEDMKVQAALHGLKQKCTDCYAGAAGEDDPVAWAIDQHDGVVAAIMDGDWNRSGSVGGLVYEAIAAAMSQPVEVVLAAFNAMSKEAREAKLKEIRKHPAFKAEYTRMQAERAAKKAAEAKPLEL